MFRSSAPKGQNKTAQGNALGYSILGVCFALKGQNNLQILQLFRPFRAWSSGFLPTQGDALGFLVPAFQAEERTADYSILFIRLTPLIR